MLGINKQPKPSIVGELDIAEQLKPSQEGERHKSQGTLVLPTYHGSISSGSFLTEQTVKKKSAICLHFSFQASSYWLAMKTPYISTTDKLLKTVGSLRVEAMDDQITNSQTLSSTLYRSGFDFSGENSKFKIHYSIISPYFQVFDLESVATLFDMSRNTLQL